MTDEMRLMVRPTKGAVAGGVAAAIADRFSLNVTMVRIVCLAAMSASEFSIALYVLLWLSIPTDRGVIKQMRLPNGDERASGSHFSQFIRKAFDQLGLRKDSQRLVSALPIGLVILLFAVSLQFTILIGTDPFRTAPIISVLAGTLGRLASAMFYASFGILLLIPSRSKTEPLILTQERERSLKLDTSERRALFGLISGIGSELGIEASLLRALAMLANIFTLGGAGAVYLGVALYLKRKKRQTQGDVVDEMSTGKPMSSSFSFSPAASRTIGLLLILIAVVRLATEYRFFFFNEGFAAGLLLCTIGAIVIGVTLKSVSTSSRARMLLLASTSIFLYGLYQISTVLFYVQLPFVARFELTFAIASLSFIYFGITAVEGKATKLAITIGLLLLLAVLGFQANLLSSRFALAIVQFYLFFYPILYATAGLWLILASNGGRTFRHIPMWLELSERRTMNLPDQPLPQ